MKAQRRAGVQVSYYDPCWGRAELAAVLDFLSGSEDPAFVGELASCIGKQLGVRTLPTDSARTAIALSLRSLGLGVGDEVLAPSYVCPAAVEPIIASGCRVKFVDIDQLFCLDPTTVGRAIRSETKAILMVHQFGRMSGVKELVDLARDHSLALIEDAGPAFGARLDGAYAGTSGDVGVLSFGPYKVLSSAGGGMLLCTDEETFGRALSLLERPRRRVWRLEDPLILAGRAFPHTCIGAIPRALRRLLRRPRPRPGFWHGQLAEMGGFEAKMTLIQLAKSSTNRSARVRNWRILDEALVGVDSVSILPSGGDGNAMQDFPVIVPREAVAGILSAARSMGYEIETGWRPLHLLPRFTALSRDDLSNTEKLWQRVVLLPIHPNVSEADAQAMAEAVRRGVGQ